MSSIHKDGDKPHWFCCFYDPEGFRRKRSTGTGRKQVAKTICLTVERAAKLAHDGKLSNENGLKLIRETCKAIEDTHGTLEANRAHQVLKGFVEDFIKIAGGELTTYTVGKWLDTWLEGRTDASKATVVTYRGVIDLFLKYLGARADRPLTTLQPKQIEDFKQHLGKRVAPSTVNRAIKVLKASFNNAVAKRQLEFSPAEHIEAIETEETNRRPFTNDELTNLLAAAGPEWRTMIFVAYYTGLRLGDCANLTWAKVDSQVDNINILTEKTKRRQILPIAEPLKRHLQTLAGDKPDAPLFWLRNTRIASSAHGRELPCLLTSGRFRRCPGKHRWQERHLETRPPDESRRVRQTAKNKLGGTAIRYTSRHWPRPNELTHNDCQIGFTIIGFIARTKTALPQSSVTSQ